MGSLASLASVLPLICIPSHHSYLLNSHTAADYDPHPSRGKLVPQAGSPCRAQGGCPRTIYYLCDKVKGRVTTLSVPFPVLLVLKSLGTLEASLPSDPILPVPHRGVHPSQTLEWKPAAGMKPGEGQRGTGPASARTGARAQDSAWETKSRDIFPQEDIGRHRAGLLELILQQNHQEGG